MEACCSRKAFGSGGNRVAAGDSPCGAEIGNASDAERDHDVRRRRKTTRMSNDVANRTRVSSDVEERRL